MEHARTRNPGYRVLLSSVCAPFGGAGEGDSVGAELFHKQVTLAQGAFSLRQTIRVWGLDFIAENIQAPAVTLHYPSVAAFKKELQRGNYTHVGINFVVATFHKVREMVPLIRRYAPEAVVVLGGYGTVLPDEVLAPFADAVCREEGIGFMRQLLGEDQGGPIKQPHVPIPAVQVLSHQRKAVVGHVTAGLGCSNACDFCCTSHFFKRKYVPFLKRGRDVYEALLATRRRARVDGVPMNGFILIDEDFFIHKRRASEFLDCVRQGGEALSLTGFGSVRGLSQFSAREIAEMGFDLVWNAFEGASSGYTKQKGRPLPELYADLKSVGTATLTSMIIGFPYQDEATMRAELEQLLALEPALMQCLIYFAFPGTPFHRQVVSERRYLPQYRRSPDLRRWDGFSMHFEHPRFDDPRRIENLQRAFYRRDFEHLGPSIVRLCRVWLDGYLTLKNDPNPLLAARAERLRLAARATLPALSAAIRRAPSKDAQQRARELRRDLIHHTGAPSATERALEIAAPLLHTATRLTARLSEQPGTLRCEYRTADALRTQHTERVLGLQSGTVGARIRGLRNALRQSAPLPAPPSWPAPDETLSLVTSRAASLPASIGWPPPNSRGEF